MIGFQLIQGVIAVIAYILIGFLGSKFNFKKHHLKVHSFTMGVLIAGLFFVFLDEVYHLENHEIYVCIVAIIFTIFFGLKIKSDNDIKHAKKELMIVSFIYEALHFFLIGVLIASLTNETLTNFLLIVVPLLFFRLSVVYEVAHQRKKTHSNMVYFIVIGFILTIFTHLPSVFHDFSLAFVTGGIFYRLISIVLSQINVKLRYMVLGELLYGGIFLFVQMSI